MDTVEKVIGLSALFSCCCSYFQEFEFCLKALIVKSTAGTDSVVHGICQQASAVWEQFWFHEVWLQIPARHFSFA